MSGLYTFLLLSILYHHGLLVSATTTTVRTTQGDSYKGIREIVQLHDGQSYTVHKFLGIPYAEKPIRFKPPHSIKSQTKAMYDATYNRPVCLQFVKNNHYIGSIKLAWGGIGGRSFNISTDMSEDCLYLNIYTPSTNCKSQKYPVMVHIHGGSYVAGTPIRDISPGEYLPRHDVVLVTIQYRLGALGFFTTGDSEAPGNLGLLDQIEALKWIQNNIDSFCGDKNSVTLLGESAGGSSVSLHYLSPLSRGLFHRGIAVSGVALTFFGFKPKSAVLSASETLIKKLGCKKQSSRLTVQCLQSKPANETVNSNAHRYNVQPFVDNNFLPDEPRRLLKEGRFKTLPLMSGFVSNEGTNAITSEPIMNNIQNYENYLRKQIFKTYLRFSKEQAPIAFDALAFEYTPWDDLDKSEAYRKNVIDLLSEYAVIAPTHDVLSFHSEHVKKTYMFEFAHRSRHHPGKIWKGVQHEDTTAYKFGLPLLRSPKTNLQFDDDDRRVSKAMVNLFTNFAKTGNPNTPSPVSGVQWTAFDSSNQAYLKIKTNPAMASKYHSRRMGFWNSYFPTLFPCKKRKAWNSQCKKGDVPRPLQEPSQESNPSTLLRGAPNPETVLW